MSKRYKKRFIDPTGKPWWGNSYISTEDAWERARSSWLKTQTAKSAAQDSAIGVTVHHAAITLYYPLLQRRAKGTIKSYWRDTYKRHIEPAVGHLPYADVRKYHIVNMINGLKQENGDPLGISKIQSVITVTRAIFAELVENRFLEHNPCDGIKMPSRKNQKVELKIDKADVNLQLSTCPRHMVSVLLLASVGLRRGEIAGFRWKDIEGNILHVRNQRLQDGTYSLPKREHIRQFDVEPEFIEKLKEYGNLDNGYVSTSKYGRAWSLSTLTRQFKDLGFPEGVGPHQLRHLACTIMAQENLIAAQKVMGHQDLATTQKYLHLEQVPTQITTETLTSVYKGVVRGEN